MKKIGWQKYETFLEEQISSSFVSDLLKKTLSQMMENVDEEDTEEYLNYEDPTASEEETKKVLPIMPLSDKIIEEALITANFDCWVGHTNFDITKEIKNTLDSIEGIEVLKVMSRYRFFIGIGKMFNFKNVRKAIENILT